MEATETYYEVQVNGKTLGLRVSSNAGGECCRENEYILDEDGDIPFRLKDEKSIKTFLRGGSTEWYNASPTSPNWDSFKKDDFSFVKVTVVKTVEPVVVTIDDELNFSDVFKKNFTKTDPRPKHKAQFGDDVHLIAVWRDRGTLAFDIDPDQVANVLQGKTLTFGDNRLFSFVDVVKEDADYYYVVMHQIDG
jgi:hypothetical protein